MKRKVCPSGFPDPHYFGVELKSDPGDAFVTLPSHSLGLSSTSLPRATSPLIVTVRAASSCLISSTDSKLTTSGAHVLYVGPESLPSTHRPWFTMQA